MIVCYGDVNGLKNKNWYAIEIHNEGTIEATIRRVALGLPKMFRDSAVEIFIPIIRRDLDVCELATGNLIYIRSDDMKCVMRLKQFTGIVGVLTMGDSRRTYDAIPIDDAYVQALIQHCEQAAGARSAGIQVGSFVRVLDSEMRDLCGTVVAISDQRAVVEIKLRLKKIIINTPLTNLLNLGHVEEAKRVHFYCELVETLDDPNLLIDSPEPESTITPEPLEPKDPRKRGLRRNTITQFIQRSIEGGITNARVLSQKMFAEVAARKLRMPSTLTIAYAVLKVQILKLHPEFKNWRALIRLSKYGVSRWDFEKLAREAGLDLQWNQSPEKLKPNDRRRREFRYSLLPPKPAKVRKVPKGNWQDPEFRKAYYKSHYKKKHLRP